MRDVVKPHCVRTKSTWKKSLLAATIAAAFVSMPAIVHATGETTGGIVGSVHTQQGASVVGAQVKITNLDTGLSREINTDTSGSYRFPQLPIGRYEVVVTQEGNVVAKQTVMVSVGGAANAQFDIADRSGAETIEVVGMRPSAIDVSTSSAGLVLSETMLDRLPVQRDNTSVALLAPGVIEGDTQFTRRLPSFGGASILENVYYLNGMNITDFVQGLGGSEVPFEFYQEFQVKTGGYSAEFGRSTGGVFNAISKRGSNEFEWGIHLFHDPESMTEDWGIVYGNDGKPVFDFSRDTASRTNLSIHASGALVQDKVFFYVMFNPEQQDNHFENDLINKIDSESDNQFWGAKLDFAITDYHTIEVTAFQDEDETIQTLSAIDPSSFSPYRRSHQPFEFEGVTGGKTWMVKYNGQITDDLSVSALVGKYENRRTAKVGDNDCFNVSDFRGRGAGGTTDPDLGNDFVNFNTGGCAFSVIVNNQDGVATRDTTRLDFDWYLGNHTLQFGIDNEKLVSEIDRRRAGDGGYSVRYDYTDPEDLNTYRGDQIRGTYYFLKGGYETRSEALYIEDVWNVSDTVTLSIGLRNDKFENDGKKGTFISITDQLAPRLGFAWDVAGDGTSKLFANFGRYYLPIANNTNERLAGGEDFYQKRYRLAAFDENNPPVFTGQLEDIPTLIENGTLVEYRHTQFGDPDADPRAVVDGDIESMYQDELILGYQWEINADWTAGVQLTRRDLKSSLDDVLIDHAIVSYYCQNVSDTPDNCDEDEAVDVTGADGSTYYVLTNPGTDMDVAFDIDGDGDLDEIQLSAAQLRYPKAERYYNAMELNFARRWDGVWSFNGSYVWSQSYGNAEGLAKSDQGQQDSGITANFDFPEFTEGAYGYQPNDRRHQFKFFGAYALTDALTLSSNLTILSGRPVSAFGTLHGAAEGYGATSHYIEVNGEQRLVPRGSWGRTPWTTTVDVGVNYNLGLKDVDASVRVDVFNLFDADNITAYTEQFDTGTPGEVNPAFMTARAYQAPRTVRLSFTANF